MGDDYTGPVTVAANDGSEIELADFNVWQQSGTIVEMVKDVDPGDTIPLAAVSPEALQKAVDYMTAFKADRTTDEYKTWVSEYKKSMEAQDQLPLLFQTINAANFMNVNTLKDELCKLVIEMIEQRTLPEILDFFNIKREYTEYTREEKQALIREHKWIDPDGLLTGHVGMSGYTMATARHERIANEPSAAGRLAGWERLQRSNTPATSRGSSSIQQVKN